MRFCIVGTGRSGTTLLRNMLNNHPDLFVFNETHWIVKMFEKFGTTPAPTDQLIHIMENSFHITGKQITPIPKSELIQLKSKFEQITIKDYCNYIGILMGKNEKKSIWADKTPDYGPFMHVIQKIWPDCKFIHVIRHGCFVAASMSRHPGYQWLASANEDSWATVSYNKYFKSMKIKKQPIEKFFSLWYRRLKRIQNEAKFLKTGTYKEIYYEDLILKPGEMLNDLCDYTGIPNNKDWKQYCSKMINPNAIMKLKEVNKEIAGIRENQLLNELGYN